MNKLTPKNLPRYGDDQLLDAEIAQYNPAVLTNSTTLYQVNHKRTELPLGTIVKVISEINDWLFIQTTYGQEGFINSETCLPFKIPKICERRIEHTLNGSFKKSKNHISESTIINLSERNVDILYLKATVIKRKKRQQNSPEQQVKHSSRSIKLIIRNDYFCNSAHTLKVKRGDMVLLIHNHMKGWFWVKNLWSQEGFIPTAVAAYRFD